MASGQEAGGVVIDGDVITVCDGIVRRHGTQTAVAGDLPGGVVRAQTGQAVHAGVPHDVERIGGVGGDRQQHYGRIVPFHHLICRMRSRSSPDSRWGAL